jgi:hypothetical protein
MPGTYELCVDEVVKAGWDYWSGDNVETCHTVTMP